MTSYCDVTNPTRHLEPMLESCKVGDYSFRMYGDVVSSDSEGKKQEKKSKKAKTSKDRRGRTMMHQAKTF